MISSTATSTASFDAALHAHRVCAGRESFYAFAKDCLRQNGRRGGAVTGNVGRFRSDFLHHLRAHVFERVLQFDFLCHGDAVLRDDRRAEFLFDYGVAALRAQRDFDRVSQNVDAAQDCLP